MWLFFYYSFNIDTKEDISYVQSGLEQLINTDEQLEIKNLNSAVNKPFKGVLYKTSFRVKKSFVLNRLSTPTIYGEVKTVDDGSQIKFRITQHWAVIFFYIFFSVFMFFGGNVLSGLFRDSKTSLIFTLLPITILLLLILTFNIEALYIKRKFVRALKKMDEVAVLQ